MMRIGQTVRIKKIPQIRGTVVKISDEDIVTFEEEETGVEIGVDILDLMPVGRESSEEED